LQAIKADAIALELFEKLRKRLLVNKFSEIDIGDFSMATVDGGISLMSLSRNLIRWKYARPGLGDPV
jgi:hypothetical protein